MDSGRATKFVMGYASLILIAAGSICHANGEPTLHSNIHEAWLKPNSDHSYSIIYSPKFLTLNNAHSKKLLNRDGSPFKAIIIQNSKNLIAATNNTSNNLVIFTGKATLSKPLILKTTLAGENYRFTRYHKDYIVQLGKRGTLHFTANTKISPNCAAAICPQNNSSLIGMNVIINKNTDSLPALSINNDRSTTSYVNIYNNTFNSRIDINTRKSDSHISFHDNTINIQSNNKTTAESALKIATDQNSTLYFDRFDHNIIMLNTKSPFATGINLQKNSQVEWDKPISDVLLQVSDSTAHATLIGIDNHSIWNGALLRSAIQTIAQKGKSQGIANHFQWSGNITDSAITSTSSGQCATAIENSNIWKGSLSTTNLAAKTNGASGISNAIVNNGKWRGSISHSNLNTYARQGMATTIYNKHNWSPIAKITNSIIIAHGKQSQSNAIYNNDDWKADITKSYISATSLQGAANALQNTLKWTGFIGQKGAKTAIMTKGNNQSKAVTNIQKQYLLNATIQTTRHSTVNLTHN